MSFQPCLFSLSAVFSASISARAACLFSLALHVFSASTRCMSFQPFRLFSAPRAACLFSPVFSARLVSPSPRAACLFSLSALSAPAHALHVFSAPG
jgi:membrane-bound metal-dependent hydrolase YbcI (DUF457 family)